MKKISVFLILTLLLFVQTPSEAGFIAEQKTKIEQQKLYNTQNAEIKALFGEMLKQANRHCLTGLQSAYSKDFVHSDGYNYDAYMKMVEDTWKAYPDITYSDKINNIHISGNYATVDVTETAVAVPKEQIGDFETVGEFYSMGRSIYHLEKHGTIWLILSETVLEETTTLKYEKTRHIDIKLEAPKQIGAGKYYTAALKVNAPKDYSVVASIGKEEYIYPQKQAENAFRRAAEDNTLERVFLSNTKNINEYVIASLSLAHIQELENDVKVMLDGIAFIMTRVNVIPENKFINLKENRSE